MLSYQVSRSIEINKNQSEIIGYLKNFKHWPSWSPWIILEPSCELTFSVIRATLELVINGMVSVLGLARLYWKVLKSID